MTAGSSQGRVGSELAAISLNISSVSTVGNETGQDVRSTAGLVVKVVGVLGLNEDGRLSRKRVGTRERSGDPGPAIVIVLATRLNGGDAALRELEMKRQVNVAEVRLITAVLTSRPCTVYCSSRAKPKTLKAPWQEVVVA